MIIRPAGSNNQNAGRQGLQHDILQLRLPLPRLRLQRLGGGRQQLVHTLQRLEKFYLYRVTMMIRYLI